MRQDIVFFSRCVDGVIYAINGQETVFSSNDTGATCATSDMISSASKVDISPDDYDTLAYLLG